MGLEIRELQANDVLQETAWDQFVRSSPDGTVFHLTAWKRVVERVFGHTPHYLLASDGSEIRGVLPLFEVWGILSGHVLISVPYGVYGGLCCSESEARNALLEAARQLGIRQRVRHVELRHLHHPEPDLPTKSLYVVFAKTIDSDPDTNFDAIPRKQRRMVRQGIKHGLDARRGWDALSGFYEIFLDSRRRLGSPPFPLRLFETIRDEFEKESGLLTIWNQGRMVAGVVSFFYQDRVMPYYGAALEEAFSLAVNDFMYWELMRESCLVGHKIFDFGRSREGTGPYDFKRHWGFEPQPLPYQYIIKNGGQIPNINPSNPRLQPFINMWKRLPLPVIRCLGPPLTRWLPLD